MSNETHATTLVKRIKKEFPGINGVEIRNNNVIFLGNVAEGGIIDNVAACNSYAYDIDPNEYIWIMGVHVKLHTIVEEAGFFVEAYDSGTYYAYRMQEIISHDI